MFNKSSKKGKCVSSSSINYLVSRSNKTTNSLDSGARTEVTKHALTTMPQPLRQSLQHSITSSEDTHDFFCCDTSISEPDYKTGMRQVFCDPEL